tara:strand:+ start:1084 stop:1344 length:261 start_codon:yes stop_codon:yes gene_type:complete
MKKILILACVAIFATSCTITYPGIATGNEATKTGEVEEVLFLGLGSVNLGVENAAKKAGITKIATVDYSVKAGLIITKYKIIVTGN